MTDPLRDIIPDSLNDPARFARTAERHLNAVTWKRQGYIPLGIIVHDPGNLEGVTYDRWLGRDWPFNP